MDGKWELLGGRGRLARRGKEIKKGHHVIYTNNKVKQKHFTDGSHIVSSVPVGVNSHIKE